MLFLLYRRGDRAQRNEAVHGHTLLHDGARRASCQGHHQLAPSPACPAACPSRAEHSGQRLCWAERGSPHSKAGVDPSYSTLFFWGHKVWTHGQLCSNTLFASMRQAAPAEGQTHAGRAGALQGHFQAEKNSPGWS